MRISDLSSDVCSSDLGFKVMSLVQLNKVSEDGVAFQSHIDGARYELTPERSIEIQDLLDATITMQLDECVKLPADEKRVAEAMRLSLRWAERCRAAFRQSDGRTEEHTSELQSLMRISFAVFCFHKKKN